MKGVGERKIDRVKIDGGVTDKREKREGRGEKRQRKHYIEIIDYSTFLE